MRLEDDWNGVGVLIRTEAPSGGTGDKVSKRGKKEPAGIKSAAT